MDRRNRPGQEPTTLETIGDQWCYTLVVVQAGDDDDNCIIFIKVSKTMYLFIGRTISIRQTSYLYSAE